MTDDPLPELPAGAFARHDSGDDLVFYAPPRLVTHIDAGAVAALTTRYRDLLLEGAACSISCRAGSATCPIVATPRSSATA